MKKCAKCGAEYDDEYDACPKCAEQAAHGSAAKRPPAGCLVVLGVVTALIAAVIVSVALSPSPKDDPALAAKVTASLGATVAPYIDTVTAQTDGSVVVTLNQTSAALAGASGANGAAELGTSIARFVLAKVPSAQSVGVLDADNKLLDAESRK